MRSIVLPWYPGGHVLLKCRAGISNSKTGMGRDPKRKNKAKNHEDCNPIKECRKKTGAQGETQELKKKKKNV